jgi:hypothetical protein
MIDYLKFRRSLVSDWQKPSLLGRSWNYSCFCNMTVMAVYSYLFVS